MKLDPPSATFAHLDLAHIAGAVAAELIREADIGSFESLDGDELLTHQHSLLRGVNVLETCIGALELDEVNHARLQKIVRDAESSAHLIHSWIVQRAKEAH